ncbi:MAG: purine-nucleoside phosphorylase [Lachnospiraceae bacterium]|nr:purine-nucleoside phosphorylase [Lachnospiraceae bacterium]
MTDNKNVLEELNIAYDSLRAKTDFIPDAAIVLGSGLGAFANKMTDTSFVSYDDIDGMPVSTVPGHSGRFVFGRVGEVKVVAMQGRVHHYEGYPMHKVVLPIRLMKLMGAKKIILTNAAGGINETFRPGDLMMITDHISSFVTSPLIGPNPEELGTRFPDMSDVYNKKLQDYVLEISRKLGIEVKKGVYLQTTGPNYETPAEIRMFRTLGADAVGMSTACEAMVAKHMGMDVIGISCITNLAAGMSKTPLNHKEVAQIADRSSKNFQSLVWNIIERMK